MYHNSKLNLTVPVHLNLPLLAVLQVITLVTTNISSSHMELENANDTVPHNTPFAYITANTENMSACRRQNMNLIRRYNYSNKRINTNVRRCSTYMYRIQAQPVNSNYVEIHAKHA